MFEIIPTRTEPNQTIFDWYKRRKKINFNPPYQRVSGLWDISGRQLFIDSLINSFDIPKFYVHRLLSSEEGYFFSIVDGKQRIQSIFDFIENKFPLSKDFVLYEDGSDKLAGKYYEEISSQYPKIINQFDQYILDVVQVVTDDEELIREMFLRLNEGVNLNNSEKRLSKNSFLNNKIKEIVNTNKLFEMIQFKNRRYEYEELLTKIILIEQEEGPVSLSKKNLDLLIDEYKYFNIKIEHILDSVNLIIENMIRIFEGKEFLLSQKSIIPIYYLFVKEKSHANSEQIGEFLSVFDVMRYENRKLDILQSNPILIEFDRLNQQGANSKNSIKKRYLIFEHFYNAFLAGTIKINTITELNENDLDD
ncbi:DUF262 domain-containing protein [Jeotgalibacillus sp. S-D1]|uniref:DUF262 domain-containing protein n=1 Tax=Jeotgalibacillus sp. S-D1 TaxID=2552189 RepID=UPI00105A9F2E|nr:DUF262 domain-containing protein [Jeotgalibacillus sp. S-D1]TDL31194.1 DUF262 domain-containing protein [Jeotgalibacillus sp. S-D1]